jgi:hypothetical protein
MWAETRSPLLFLLRQNRPWRNRCEIGMQQQGHRESVRASAMTNRLRMVAIEFGM